MSLGSNISNKRKSLKLSQEYVAEQVGVSRQAVSKWETHQSEPSTANLIKLAGLFDCDIKELVSPEQYVREQKDVETQIESSQKNIKMQMAAVFGRVLTLIGFLGYIGAYADPASYQLPNWFLHIWWGVFFSIGLVLSFVASSDYFKRKSGSKKLYGLICYLFSLSFFMRCYLLKKI